MATAFPVPAPTDRGNEIRPCLRTLEDLGYLTYRQVLHRTNLVLAASCPFVMTDCLLVNAFGSTFVFRYTRLFSA